MAPTKTTPSFRTSSRCDAPGAARPLVKSLNRKALAGNCDYLRRVCAASRLMAVVKADAYGHGLVETARALARADGFAVACVAEGLALRRAGVAQKILVLQGCRDAREFALAREAGLALVAHRERQLEWLEAGGAVETWIKFDTGMHRLGFAPGSHAQIVPRVLDVKGLPRPPVLMSHLACADGEDDDYNRRQIREFAAIRRCYRAHGLQASLANSAAALRLPETRCDWVRAGLAIYGVAPPGCDDHGRRLKPAMCLRAPVVAVQRLQTGDRVGYGGDHRCRAPTRVAVVAAGYGDGYPRHAAAGTPVWLAGARRPLLGRVSMDMIAVDVTGADVEAGAVAELWGAHLPVAAVAAHCATIPYELLCAAGARDAAAKES